MCTHRRQCYTYSRDSDILWHYKSIHATSTHDKLVLTKCVCHMFEFLCILSRYSSLCIQRQHSFCIVRYFSCITCDNAIWKAYSLCTRITLYYITLLWAKSIEIATTKLYGNLNAITAIVYHQSKLILCKPNLFIICSCLK